MSGQYSQLNPAAVESVAKRLIIAARLPGLQTTHEADKMQFGELSPNCISMVMGLQNWLSAP